MTSEPTELFVYITLPGETAPITAGKYRLSAARTGEALGEFVYGHSYLARNNAVELDPVHLHLRTAFYATTGLKGNFGALRDASPDFWGRKLIEKRLGAATELPDIVYMLNSPDDRAGALGFGLNQKPPAPVRTFNRTMDLARVLEVAESIMADDHHHDDHHHDDHDGGVHGEDAEQVKQLMLAGTSMGGARPKATVQDDGYLWVAKFPHEQDRWNNPRVEHAMLKLAKLCGLSAADSKMVSAAGKDVLMVRRFDRRPADDGYYRSRMVSGLTMLRADEHEREKWSYLALADELRRAAGGQQEAQLIELYRRVAFNVLISNTDDHPRNHAFVSWTDGWDLSPAYDLTPTPAMSFTRDLAMSFGDFGRRATRENLLSQARRFYLSPEEAAGIVDEMAKAVQENWYSVCRSVGVTEKDCSAISRAFGNEGYNTQYER